MRIAFFASDKPRERALAKSFAQGAAQHGHEVRIVPLGPDNDPRGFDVAAMVGVKSARIFRACQQAGVVPLMLDKGYIRDRRAGERVWEFWRVAIGAHHPTDRLGERQPADRFEELARTHQIAIAPWRAGGDHIILAGSSAKYHAFYGLPDPTSWAREVVTHLRLHTERPIVYRPKPSWGDAVPIRKTTFSGPKDKLGPLLQDAWAVVTHGSNISFEAALAGIPSIVLGNGIGRPISSSALAEIENPRLAKRKQWLHNLCYWQWTEDEMRAGEMWRFLEPRIRAVK